MAKVTGITEKRCSVCNKLFMVCNRNGWMWKTNIKVDGKYRLAYQCSRNCKAKLEGEIEKRRHPQGRTTSVKKY